MGLQTVTYSRGAAGSGATAASASHGGGGVRAPVVEGLRCRTNLVGPDPLDQGLPSELGTASRAVDQSLWRCRAEGPAGDQMSAGHDVGPSASSGRGQPAPPCRLPQRQRCGPGTTEGCPGWSRWGTDAAAPGGLAERTHKVSGPGPETGGVQEQCSL
ncbi:hypothetical protein NDU88_008989 [Pleurodeles waltl]|uniref:Uncharacterized protein n=1 Tax=Pleurodeles waltl TaxID=8319 RepID=A0AAV7QTJ2_PLEWA|nr:hypothetical protein NDU88_008989 [Pleurodeles waltl]